MPLYEFEHKETKEKITILSKPEDKFNMLQEVVDDPENWEQRFNMNISSSGGKTNMSKYTSEGFKDRLRVIKKANPGSTIDV